jgi:23S rRNA-intervening sequence protein
MNEERSSVISNRRNKIENFIYARSLRDLLVCREAFIVSQKFFNLSKDFPDREKYALTSHIRRASRSVGAARFGDH